MKNRIYILFCVLFFSMNAYSNDLLREAEKAYDSKNYKAAIASYEKLIADGYKSYQLYYNLGNAYYRNNDLGKAIYCYELARKINPNDEDVRINIGIASAKTIDKIDSKENFFISAVKSNLLSSFTTDTWARFTIAALLFSAILFFVFVNSGILIVKRVSFLLSCILAITFVVTYFLGYSALKSKIENKFAIITSKEIKIMNEPTSSASSKFSLHEGTKIRVVENNGDWILIKLDNGNEGWVKVSDVGII
ncbi:MAG: tetratricopeptide repeat protein [Bacteroidota bacterium]